MKVVKLFPPNYATIRKAFPQIRGQSIIFAYGDMIYYPGPGKLSNALIAHETVHSLRQGSDPAGWWSRYLDDPKYRMEEEVLAHRAEYLALLNIGASAHELDKVARRLSSPLYGGNLTPEQARVLIAA